MGKTHEFEIFADYFQFYLQDEKAKGDLSDSWTKDAVQRLLALAPSTIGVGTVRNMTVPVAVDILDAPPALDLEPWDHVVECDIDVPSGSLVITGCTDYFPDAARIPLDPGQYRARVQYGALRSLSSDGLDGDDHYRILMWKEHQPAGLDILKRRETD